MKLFAKRATLGFTTFYLVGLFPNHWLADHLWNATIYVVSHVS